MAAEKLEELYRQALTVIPGGAPGGLRREFHQKLGPLVVSEAYGSRIRLVDGRELLDYHMAFGAVLLGHRDPDVVEAVRQQLDRLILHGAGVSDVEVEAAKEIVKTIPSAEMVVFTPSGSEAVMAAIRLARAVTGRTLIVKFEGNYHGWHDYSLYNVSTPASRGVVAETRGIPDEVKKTIMVLPYNNVEAFKKFMEEGGCDKTAAVIMEPVAHSMGVIPARKEFVKTVEKLSKTCGALLVFDEVVTAIRHHLRGMQYELGVTPDLTVLGKAIANGMPVGALAGHKSVMEELTRGVTVSGTYQSHPLSMAAVVASIRKAWRIRADLEAARKGEEHAKVLKELVEEAGVKAYVAGFRSTITVYFGLDSWPQNLGEALKADAKAYEVFANMLWSKGVLVTPNPRKRMHISVAHTMGDLEVFADAVREALRKVLEERPSLKA